MVFFQNDNPQIYFGYRISDILYSEKKLIFSKKTAFIFSLVPNTETLSKVLSEKNTMKLFRVLSFATNAHI